MRSGAMPLMVERHASLDPVRPGGILREDVLPALAMSKTAVAGALQISRQTLYDLLNEKQPVTAEMAVRFGTLFGNGPTSGSTCSAPATWRSLNAQSTCPKSRLSGRERERDRFVP